MAPLSVLIQHGEGGELACVCQAEQYSYLPQLLTYQVEIGAITLPREGGWF